VGHKDLKFSCESVSFLWFVSKGNLPGLFAAKVMLIHTKPVSVL